jgi:hypothetical protein
VTEKIVDGFREGYAEDVTKKENSEKWLELRVTKVPEVNIVCQEVLDFFPNRLDG